jgi:hypothetical protein
MENVNKQPRNFGEGVKKIVSQENLLSPENETGNAISP